MSGGGPSSLSGATAFWAGTRATLQRDLRIFMSYRMRLVALMLGQIFSLTLFYYISRLVEVPAFGSPDAYYAFAVVGLIILQVLNSVLGTPPANLRQELVAGTFERVYHSPLGPVAGLIASLVWPFLYALANAVVMLAFASVVFGLDLRWSTVPLAIPLAVLGALAFMAFGLLLLALTMVAKQAVQGTTWIIAGISLIAGLYFPVALLPDWIEWASQVQPFTPTVDMLRNALVGREMPDPWLENLATVIGFALATIPVAVLALRASIGKARKTGTIIEY